MNTVIYVPEGTDCSLHLYLQNPDMYRGNISCTCDQKAWFVKASAGKNGRGPYFAAHHADDCGYKITLIADDLGAAISGEPATLNVDLDKQRKQSIEVAVPAPSPIKESKWGTTRTYSNVGEYPENKSLRQMLTSLGHNPDYPDADKKVRMVADGGRVVLEGLLSDFIVSQSEISHAPLAEIRIFWGRINNVNKNNGVLWLNCGDYKTEPSILIDDEDLEVDLIEDFKLQDFDQLQGADFIVVGAAFQAQNGKPYIKFAFTKYIAFRKYTIA